MGQLRNISVKTPSTARLENAARDMYEALKAYELLDDKVSNCDEHEPEMAPETCEACFDFADDARLKMRAAISKAEGR